MNLPGFLLRHVVTVEPYLGTGAYGPQYGPAVTVKCFRDDTRRLVQATAGGEVMSESTLYCLPSAVIPLESRVTLQDGRKYTVITSKLRDGGGLPVPSHLEVSMK